MHAWAAGVIDGEGCFQITKAVPGRQPTLRIVVSMVCEDTIQALGGLFPEGTVKTLYPPSHRAAGKRRQWTFQAVSRDAVASVIQKCGPYFITKREQALVFQSFLENCPGGKNTKLSEEQVKLRLEHRERIMNLNYYPVKHRAA